MSVTFRLQVNSHLQVHLESGSLHFFQRFVSMASSASSITSVTEINHNIFALKLRILVSYQKRFSLYDLPTGWDEGIP